MRQARGQKGFTIIELVVVILLLGILAATALPRFMDVTDEAHEAVVSAVEGGLVTGAALFRAQWVATGQIPAAAVSEYGDGNLFPNLSGYPIGTDTTIDAGACLQIYDGLLQSGRPSAVAGPFGSDDGTPARINDTDLDTASIIVTTATPAQIETAANGTADIVAVTGTAIYCKNDGTTAACDGLAPYYTSASAAHAGDGDDGTDLATALAAQTADGGSCSFYYTGQYKEAETDLTIPRLVFSLTDGSISRSTVAFE